mmetsp:Transcript_6365/g.3600  ORF Transcript_6365/g.3600 Transcript_6365/m.3600 type:complete len:92 (+) Transcript_6365:421-696(+)|eukprot:CAMPEP_0201281460 /NCGR_PEP_ID=MMETSP1317-20130820/2771_1 /ASSEMBLY_ACC=CAM_ASM_000770 /TAXON_ID=187299 /ORGANISM="Undescribed Undescribed, Strain Undescribed" /LENGTH=91 /DNA_ID=CAMNT_0047591263 /DNA_START=410 /DNA_END=685 /DNA_ORIENTATION=-
MDICCVVDVSGSMQVEATMTGTSGDKESYGLSQLDVVKHAVKTVIHNLQPQDRLALVVFSTESRIVFGLKSMSENEKKLAIKELEALNTEN